MEQPALMTKRLILRPYSISDVERVTELAGNYDVAKTTQNIPHPYTLDMAREWIDSIQKSLVDGDKLAYAIDLKEQQLLVGTASLVNIQNSEASLGYWIGKPYWGNGICTEAVSALLGYAFEQLKLKRIFADHYAHNVASGMVMKKNGMHHLGSRSEADRNGDLIMIERYEIFGT